MGAFLCLLLAAPVPALAASDALAPEGPGFAAQGMNVDVVVRRLPQAGKLKLLVSDALTDAPLQADIEVERFGRVGQSAKAKATAGQYPGHFLVDLPGAFSGRESLVIRVSVAGRDPEILAVDAISGERPAESSPRPVGKSLPDLTVVALAALGLAFLVRRRRVLLAALLASVLWAGGDARAHGPGGDVAPEPPGSILYLSQEIQFALGLRTARVDLRTFQPPPQPAGRAISNDRAARQYPAIPRSAVVERYGKKLVIVRLGPERFVAREVQLGWPEPDFIAVERGVNPGENVVVDGASFLRNGGAVAP
jgi:hypothetical protein